MSGVRESHKAADGSGETLVGHERELLVWDVPAGVGANQPLTIRVGCKCPAGCSPAGWHFETYDHEGRVMAKARASSEPWPGTAALFHAELTLLAPADVGRYDWRVVATAANAAIRDDGVAPAASDDEAGAGHTRVETTIAIRVVPDAAYRLRVLAVDRDSGEPVVGARVVVHPLQTRTDALGVAELDLPAGPFRLFVSGPGLHPCRRDGDLGGDLTIRAEIEADREPSDAELWT